MKSILISLIFYSLMQAQGFTTLGLLMGDESTFDFSSVGNLQIDLNADNATVDSISDVSGNWRKAVLFNSPTIASEINGHNTITFNGTDEYGITGAFTLNQPTTVYYVVKEVSFTENDRTLNARGSQNNALIDQYSGNALRFYAGAAVAYIPSNVSDYRILTFVCNGASSEARVNSDNATIGNGGANAWGGFVIARDLSGGNYANIKFVRLLAYSAAHNTATQNTIINELNKLYKIY